MSRSYTGRHWPETVQRVPADYWPEQEPRRPADAQTAVIPAVTSPAPWFGPDQTTDTREEQR